MYFLYYDDVNDMLSCDKMKILVENLDGSFSLKKLPAYIPRKLSEYQNSIGKIVYILHKEKDSKIIKKYVDKLKYLEKLDEDKYNVISIYDDKNIDTINTLSVPNRKFVHISKLKGKLVDRKMYMLKYHDDGLVSVHEPPIVINKSIFQYELQGNCLFVSDYHESDNLSLDDIIELEKTNKENMYYAINVYKKGKVNVKR